eukprot:1194862-Prorocentrum_minimum.AAC.4
MLSSPVAIRAAHPAPGGPAGGQQGVSRGSAGGQQGVSRGSAGEQKTGSPALVLSPACWQSSFDTSLHFTLLHEPVHNKLDAGGRCNARVGEETRPCPTSRRVPSRSLKSDVRSALTGSAKSVIASVMPSKAARS